jgi:ubiquinone/menaquinone biosynthesis C-methylase UbiE
MKIDQQQLAIEEHSAKANWFADEYRKGGTDPYSDCFAYSRRRLDEVLATRVPSPRAGAKLLDVGCGTGKYMERYAAAGYNVVGVDGSEDMLRLAQQNNLTAEFHKSSVESLPFGTASFDVLLCIEVIRYLPDPDRCIAEMARVTRPGGVCITTAPPYLNANGYWLINKIARGLQPKRLSSLRQYFVWPDQLARKFQREGFNKAEVISVYTGPVNWWERLARAHLKRVLRWWEPFDAALCRSAMLAPFANMIVIQATK